MSVIGHLLKMCKNAAFLIVCKASLGLDSAFFAVFLFNMHENRFENIVSSTNTIQKNCCNFGKYLL
jgi:hypothetical protein